MYSNFHENGYEESSFEDNNHRSFDLMDCTIPTQFFIDNDSEIMNKPIQFFNFPQSIDVEKKTSFLEVSKRCCESMKDGKQSSPHLKAKFTKTFKEFVSQCCIRFNYPKVMSWKKVAILVWERMQKKFPYVSRL